MRVNPLIIGAMCGGICTAIGFIGGMLSATRVVIEAPKPPAMKIEKSDEREVQILALFIGRNPGSTIEDFQDCVRTLLTESARAGIDYRVVLATIEKESQFNPRAVSYAGAIGLMQLMPNTGAEIAKAMGWPFVPPVKSTSGKGYASLGSLGDPSFNVRVGIIHLRDHVSRFGLNATAFRAYNRGEVHARANRPADRYAEDIALNTIAFVSRFQEGSAR